VQVWKIEDFLAKWENVVQSSGQKTATEAGAAAIAAVLLNEVDAYRWVHFVHTYTLCAITRNAAVRSFARYRFL
jgi:hypothetical protein